MPGRDRAGFPCSGRDLLFLQRICSKRRHDSLRRAGFAAAQGAFAAFAAKEQGKEQQTFPPAIAPSRGIAALILPQCGGFRVGYGARLAVTHNRDVNEHRGHTPWAAIFARHRSCGTVVSRP
jgi:hypothetical protein